MFTFETLHQSLLFPSELIPVLGVLLLPFLGFLVFAGWGRRFSDKVGWLALALIGISFFSALLLLVNSWDNPLSWRFTWISLPGGELPILFTGGIRVDHLAGLMTVLVTGISFFVHLFSIEYMKGQEYLHRYWAYLGLFVFSMLGIILSNSLLFIFIFWELVGLSSYFLIGFWFRKDLPARASQKHFWSTELGMHSF